MNRNRLLSILAASYMIITAAAIFYLYKENQELREQHRSKAPALYSRAQLNTPPSNEIQSTNTQLLEENEELNKKINQLGDMLADVQMQIESRRKILNHPIENILSSRLMTKVKEGEVLVTGGYQTADGRSKYHVVEPKLEEFPDGREVIQLEISNYGFDPEVIVDSKLDSLSTSSRNTLQHGEIWLTGDLEAEYENIANRNGTLGERKTNVSVSPGGKVEITMNDYWITGTANFSENGDGFDIDLRFVEPR